MRNIFILAFSMLAAINSFAQTNADKPRFPEYIDKGTLPDFKVIAAPDSTEFTKADLKKKKPLLLMIFSPECGHCQHETKLIEQNMEHFKHAQILMVTWLPYSTLKDFARDYNTTAYPNITLVQDPNDFFYAYYEVHRYPKLIIYNKDGYYVSDYDGNIPLEDVWKDLNAE